MKFIRTKTLKTQKAQLNSSGFTIVELLIFIAISLALFVSAMMLVGGRQHKTEFQTGVTEFVQQLQSIANDVSSGNYERPPEMRCTLVVGVPTFSDVGGSPGKNSDCVFIGRAVHFAPDGNAGEYNVLSIVGRRQITPGPSVPKRDIQSLAEANARVIPATIAPNRVRIPGGLELKHINSGGTGPAVVAFYTNFAQVGPSGGSDIESGARNVRVVPIPINMGQPLNTVTGLVQANTNETGGQVVLCVEHGAAGRSALIRIGGSDGSATVNSRVQEGGC
jgi:type II secretory pathway pseudopilin PulG